MSGLNKRSVHADCISISLGSLGLAILHCVPS